MSEQAEASTLAGKRRQAMQYVHAEHPLWLKWFLDSENIDAAALRAALRVVPTVLWPSVQRDIGFGLSEAITTVAKEASEGEAVDALLVPFPDLELKQTLLSEETARRRTVM
jgi:hypothetical protein